MRLFKLSILIFLSVFSVSARAQFFAGPAASGAGGGGRAAVDLGESTFLNPAGIAFVQRYNASAFYGLGKHPSEGESTTFGASLADGQADSIVPGALTFVRKRTDQNGVSNTQTDIQLSVGNFAFRKFALGFAGHRLQDQILSAVSGTEYTQFNMHVGAIFVPMPSVGIGLVAYDVLPSDSTPVPFRVIPTLAIGANYLYEKFFRARFDLVRPDTRNEGRRINVQAGLETYLQEMVALRLGGYWKETADQSYMTAGLGYKGPRLSIDYSFQKDVRDTDNSRHLIDLWLPL